MRVALDCDGVLADFVGSFTSLAVDMDIPGAQVITGEDQPSWDFDFDTNPVWECVRQSWNWWMGLAPLVTEGEVDLLNEVIAKHEVYFITSRVRGRGLSVEWQTLHWLEGIGVSVGRRAHVIATRAKTKGPLAEALDISIALDDSPKCLESYRRHGITAVARRWPYNKDWEPYVKSVRNFLWQYVLQADPEPLTPAGYNHVIAGLRSGGQT